MKISKTIGLALLMTLVIQVSRTQPKGELADEIIAKVDNYIVLKSDLEGAYQQALSNGQYGANLKCQIFSQLITQKLMVAKAEIDSIVVSPLELDDNLDRRMQIIIQQTGGSEEQLEAYYGKVSSKFGKKYVMILKNDWSYNVCRLTSLVASM